MFSFTSSSLDRFWKSRGEIGVGVQERWPYDCLGLIAYSILWRPDFLPVDSLLLYYNSPHWWKRELSVSRDHDNDFQLYFTDSLSSFHRQYRVAFGERRWHPRWDGSKTIHICSHNLRFIIDRDALSSQRQLKDVLCSPVNPSQTEPETQTLATGELDVFWLMIMARISTQPSPCHPTSPPSHALRILHACIR